MILNSRRDSDDLNNIDVIDNETDKILNDDQNEIISNISEYLKNNNLSELLQLDPEEERLVEMNADDVCGTQEDILNILRMATRHDDQMISDLSKRATNMNNSLDYYSSFMLEDKLEVKARNLKKAFINTEYESDEEYSGNESDTQEYPTSSGISERIKQTGIKLPSSSRSKKVISDASLTKTIDGIMFVGFDNNELTELPGFQEAPQLLNNLSLKMNFKSSFMQYWSAIVRSEASCAILQDSFWWFFLKNFKKDNINLERDAFKYFCRISESFMALFMSIDPSIRDRFFNKYADFLSQAVYTVFYRAFPDSRLQFGDNFKQNICDTLFEWILGIRTIPGNYKNWMINPDININTTSDIKITSTSELLSKITNLEKFLSKLGNNDEPEQRPKTPEKSTAQKVQSLKAQKQDKNARIIQFYERNPSHVANEGTVVEKFNFNLKGQSVLISHYLNMRNLQAQRINGSLITRSQIVQQPGINDPTYKDIINQSLQKAKDLEEKFKELSRSNKMEIKKIVKEQKAARSETNRFKEMGAHEFSESPPKKTKKIKTKEPMKVTKPVPTLLKLKKLEINDEPKWDIASVSSGEMSDRSIATLSPSKDLKSFRPYEIIEDLKEEDEEGY